VRPEAPPASVHFVFSGPRIACALLNSRGAHRRLTPFGYGGFGPPWSNISSASSATAAVAALPHICVLACVAGAGWRRQRDSGWGEAFGKWLLSAHTLCAHLRLGEKKRLQNSGMHGVVLLPTMYQLGFGLSRPSPPKLSPRHTRIGFRGRPGVAQTELWAPDPKVLRRNTSCPPDAARYVRPRLRWGRKTSEPWETWTWLRLQTFHSASGRRARRVKTSRQRDRRFRRRVVDDASRP